MRSLQFFLLAGCSVFIFAAHGQDLTNAPATKIENFESQTGTVIVKGFGPPVSMTISAGIFSVRCKESTDASTGRKEYGITATLTANQASEFLAVDYDELEPLIRGLDYLAKINYDVTTLPSFNAAITTRSGLRIGAHSEQRQGGIQDFLQFGNTPRIPLTSDQFLQFQNLIGQAKASLDALQKNSAP